VFDNYKFFLLKIIRNVLKHHKKNANFTRF